MSPVVEHRRCPLPRHLERATGRGRSPGHSPALAFLAPRPAPAKSPSAAVKAAPHGRRAMFWAATALPMDWFSRREEVARGRNRRSGSRSRPCQSRIRRRQGGVALPTGVQTGPARPARSTPTTCCRQRLTCVGLLCHRHARLPRRSVDRRGPMRMLLPPVGLPSSRVESAKVLTSDPRRTADLRVEGLPLSSATTARRRQDGRRGRPCSGGRPRSPRRSALS